VPCAPTCRSSPLATTGPRRARQNVVPITRALSVAVSVALAGIVLSVPAPAFAHSQLVSTKPAGGATLTESASSVSLTFNEPVKQRFSTIVVNGPGAVSYSRGNVRVIDNTAYQDVYALRSGSYTVAWRVVSADGHPVSGEFAFTVSLPPQLEPTGSPPTNAPAAQQVADASGTGLWWWLAVGGVFIAIILVTVALARRRRRVDRS
jgi:copper resistance protein C